MVNPCLILGYNSLDKTSDIIFIARQKMPRNIKLSPFLIIGQHSRTHLAETFDIPKMLVRIDCTPPKVMHTSLAMHCRSHLLSHITRVCTTLKFTSVVASLGRPDRQSSSTHSLSLLNSSAHFITVLSEGDSFPRVSMMIHEFPWEAFLSYRIT